MWISYVRPRQSGGQEIHSVVETGVIRFGLTCFASRSAGKDGEKSLHSVSCCGSSISVTDSLVHSRDPILLNYRAPFIIGVPIIAPAKN